MTFNLSFLIIFCYWSCWNDFCTAYCLFSHHIRQTDNKESNSISLRRIFELEQTQYRLNDKISALEQKLEKKDDAISSLQAEVTKLKKELREKNHQLNKQKEETTLSVGFLLYLLILHSLSICLFKFSFNCMHFNVQTDSKLFFKLLA